MKRIVIFGAGSVGRGFIGQIFSQAGWRVTFVDMDAELVAALRSGSYRHATVSDAGTEEVSVDNVDAILGSRRDAVVDAVAAADFVATAVGAANLRHIAPALADGIRGRSGRPLDVLLAENLHDADEVARGLVAEALGDDAHLLGEVGFLRTSIGRMIPVPTAEQRAADVSWVAVEPYRELPYDAAAAKAPLPDVPDLVGRTDLPFAFYADRKLYLHNLGHALTAYLGRLLGYTEIAEAIEDPRIHRLVSAAMSAATQALSREYGEPLEAVAANRDDLLARFANHALHDSVERVGRDPRRKLAPGDRFLGAVELTARHGLQAPVSVAVAVGTDALLKELDPNERPNALAALREKVAAAGPAEAARFDAALEALSPVADLERLAELGR